jgi:hypothetical protein
MVQFIVPNVIEVNKPFKAAKIDPFAVSADNGQRAESFGETLKLEYAGYDYLSQLGADFRGSGFSTMIGK